MMAACNHHVHFDACHHLVMIGASFTCDCGVTSESTYCCLCGETQEERMSDDPLAAAVDMMHRVRTAPPVGTEQNQYVVLVPKWFEALCDEEGTTPQEVYDRRFGHSSFRHGRVEVVVD